MLHLFGKPMRLAYQSVCFGQAAAISCQNDLIKRKNRLKTAGGFRNTQGYNQSLSVTLRLVLNLSSVISRITSF
jgi:hypothetical protein